ncbi:MAG TPA: histidine kinase N-terminal 7TM domain-containing protein [Anaerolineae bacterium]|nr:histidine kinase N-terminal 7TM domain-containing protein [Anaerolineae bacterium]HMR64048.1 histidine kinase N-terminal 7TM domain-containing protein [Anaerolineae bacterium]
MIGHSWHFTPHISPLLLAGLVSVLLGIYAWRRRSTTGATAFTLLTLTVAIWSFGYVLEIASGDRAVKIFWAKVQYFGITGTPLAWLAFALQFTNREKWLTRRNIALFAVIPLLTIPIVWTTEWHGLLWSRIDFDPQAPFEPLKLSYGLWFWVNWLFANVMLIIGSGLLINMFLRAPRLYRMQTGLLLLVALAPWLGNAIYVLGFAPLTNFDLTPVGFALSTLLVAWSLFQFKLLDIVPVARSAVVEVMGDGVLVIDNQRRIVDLNPVAQLILGHNASQVVGRTIDQGLATWPELYHYLVDMLPLTEAQTELTQAQPGRSPNYFDVHLSPLRDRRRQVTGWLIVLHDITERKQAEQALRESEGKFRILAETTTAAIMIHKGSKILYVNPAAERISGFSRTELLRMDFWQLVHPDFQELVRFRSTERLEGKAHPAHYEIKFLAKSGAELWGEITVGRIEFEGGPAVLGTIFDVTERNRAKEALVMARDEALQASHFKSELLAKVSHELRTPLNAILGYSELIESGAFGPVTDQQREALSYVIQSTDYLTEIVSELLEQAQLEASTLKLQLSTFAPREILDTTTDKMNVLAQAKQLTLTAEIAPNLPPSLCGDKKRLQQILLNLVGNAIKFTEQGDIRIYFYCPTPAHWAMQVTDTGPGIPPEAQARIFDSFWQVDGSITRRHDGTGLGLSIVKQLTELMQGQITVDSEVGRGTTFTVTFPADQSVS